MKHLIIASVLLGLASSPVWGQEYHDHTMEYQLDAEQAEQISQNEQMREQRYGNQLRMQAMQERIDELEFQKSVKDMNDAAKGSTYFPPE